MSGRAWQVKNGGDKIVTTIDDLQSLLLQQREIADATSFFQLDYERDVVEPDNFANMRQACDRIYTAIENSESIVIHGDYDADGITSTAVLLQLLQDLGAHVTPYLPSREDGYGLNAETIKHLSEDVSLLITVDCGISNPNEIAWLKKKGIDTVVVDHHVLPKKMPAAIIIHPLLPENKQVDKNLCGVGTTWKLASGLLRDERSSLVSDLDYEKWLLDLVAIGTVADMVSLKGENRLLVTFGLEILRRTKRLGLKSLIDALQLEDINAETIAFKVIPVLNAAGRLSHPQPALELLLASDQKKADKLVEELLAINRKRQTLTRKIVKEASVQINGDPIIFAHNRAWAPGMVGLVAGRLADKYNKPAIVVGGNDNHAVGSARAPAGVNILQLLTEQKELLLKIGGHSQAAGFSIDYKQVQALQENVQSGIDVDEELDESPPLADVVLDINIVNSSLIALLEKFSPFGFDNQYPIFILENVNLLDWRPVGKDQNHAKFTFEHDHGELGGIGFDLAAIAATLPESGPVDVIGKISEDTWMGQRRIQLQVTDIAPAGKVTVNVSNST